jgi:hypothetical protein
MLFTAKCYWPGVTESEVATNATRAAANDSRARGGAAYLGSILLPDDELVLCLFEAAAGAAVKRASESAGFPCERVMESVWLAAPEARLRRPAIDRLAGEH